MKKSREIFVVVLASIIIASISAIIAGLYLGEESMKYLLLVIFGIQTANGIYLIIWGIPKTKPAVSIIMTILSIILIGMLIGILNLLPWLSYLIILLVSIILAVVFFFGLTGEEKEESSYKK